MTHSNLFYVLGTALKKHTVSELRAPMKRESKMISHFPQAALLARYTDIANRRVARRAWQSQSSRHPPLAIFP
jgi:hypothetical protein